MKSVTVHPRRCARWTAVILAALWLAAASSCSPGGGGSGVPDVGPSETIQPAELAGLLAGTTAARPVLIHVGFEPLYRAGAIPRSVYAGAGSRPEGIAGLRQAVAGLPRDTGVVIYCGCCPWRDCPNMRPAQAVLREMGFTNARSLYVAKNLETDWARAGYPLVKPTP